LATALEEFARQTETRDFTITYLQGWAIYGINFNDSFLRIWTNSEHMDQSSDGHSRPKSLRLYSDSKWFANIFRALLVFNYIY